jgi:hypothetical protein
MAPFSEWWWRRHHEPFDWARECPELRDPAGHVRRLTPSAPADGA